MVRGWQMYESLGDLITSLSGATPEPTVVTGVRGRAWLAHALWLSGLPLKDFTHRHVYRGREVSSLVYKWSNGRATPSRQSVVAVEKSLPGSMWVFDLPIWRLLANRPIGARTVESIARQYCSRHELISMWWFPGDDQRLADRTYVSVLYSDTQRLVYRNDLWGFIGTLIRTRQTEAACDAEGHVLSSKDMIRSLPGALRLPWLRGLASELLTLVNSVRCRMQYSASLYDVDMEIVLRQADDPDYEPCRERRKRDPKTWCFIDVEDPVLPAIIIPGKLVRDKAQSRRRRRPE